MNNTTVFSKALLRYSWHMTNCTLMLDNLISCDIYIHTYETLVKIMSWYVTFKGFSYLFVILPSDSLMTLSPCLQATTYLLSVSIGKFALSRVLYKWNCTVCTLFWSGFFHSSFHSRFIHAGASIDTLTLLLGTVGFVDIPQSVYSVTCGRTSVSFPVWASEGWDRYEHLCTTLCVDKRVHLSSVKT